MLRLHYIMFLNYFLYILSIHLVGTVIGNGTEIIGIPAKKLI